LLTFLGDSKKNYFSLYVPKHILVRSLYISLNVYGNLLKYTNNIIHGLSVKELLQS